MRLVTYVVLLLTLTSCATGVSFTEVKKPKDGEAVVYVLRPWYLYDGAATLEVRINDTRKAKLQNGGFVRIPIKPTSGKISLGAYGIAKLNWSHKPFVVDFDIAENEVKYMLMQMSYNGFNGKIGFGEVSESTALSILPELKMSKNALITNQGSGP